jgi:hypothetical protein
MGKYSDDLSRRLRSKEDEEGMTMDEAAPRTWATGAIKIAANDRDCFDWSGTRAQAIEKEKIFLDITNRLGLNAHSYAKRAAGYLMAYGMPQAGEPDMRPSNLGKSWDSVDVELYKLAILWLVLREHIPNTGLKVEDVFVGKSLLAAFNGDPKEILDETLRELNGQPFSGEEFKMMVGVLGDCPLDPATAVTMAEKDILALANHPLADEFGDTPIYVPRIPHDAAEAKAMLEMATIFTDMTDPVALANPEAGIKHYAGFTDDELRRGKPAVRVR